MARQPRVDLGDYVYHVINRANGRAKMFGSPHEYADFESLLLEIVETFDMRILAYVVMPNHWHMLLYPRKDGDMGKALQWLGTTHVRRHHTRSGTIGGGHLYQGRYKSIPIEEDRHLLSVLKYIERNPVRAKLAKRPDDWKWGSAFRRLHGTPKQKKLLSSGPVDLPSEYRRWITYPEPSEELKDIRYSVKKGVPYGRVILEKKIIQ